MRVIAIPLSVTEEIVVGALVLNPTKSMRSLPEAREKLGEARVDDREADKLLVLTEKAGWLHLDNTPVNVRVEALLPKAFARLADIPEESERSA